MGSLGRNFDFRVTPDASSRAGRFSVDAEIAIGAPVQGSGDFDALGREIVEQASAATPPIKGRCGIVVFEHIMYQDVDPALTTYSDLGTAPADQAVQVVSGPNVKVVFTNTEDSTFLHSRSYAGRLMVVGAGATPTVAVGNYLEPVANGDDTDGYWQETATLANAWLVVTSVDTDRGEVEAQFLF